MKIQIKVIVSIALVFAAVPVCASSNRFRDLAWKAAARGHYAQAAIFFQKSCEQNDPASCTALGNQYEDGAGVPQDATEAAALFQKGCDLRDNDACRHIG